MSKPEAFIRASILERAAAADLQRSRIGWAAIRARERQPTFQAMIARLTKPKP